MRIIREHIFDTLQSIYMLLHRRGQYIIWPAGAHNGVARHIYVPDAIFSNRFGPKQEHKMPYRIDICSLPSASQERTLQCTQISRNPNLDKYISIFGQINLAFWTNTFAIWTILLAPTGALIVIVCYCISSSSSRGHFLKFWAFLPICI